MPAPVAAAAQLVSLAVAGPPEDDLKKDKKAKTGYYLEYSVLTVFSV